MHLMSDLTHLSRNDAQTGAEMSASQVARRMWTLFEPIHAMTYFAAEARAAYEEAGLRGFWRGYFAGRSAPLGRRQRGAGHGVLLYVRTADGRPGAARRLGPDHA